MTDRMPIRDRTLILRILVPGLETRLRDKMKEVEDTADDNTGGTSTPNASSSVAGGGPSSSSTHTANQSSSNRETLLDLDGVTCEPTQDKSTLWNFHCDGATYPARLVNLPCPIELHKTHDHARFYKSKDIAQMLIVYEDDVALDEADAVPKIDGYPSYFHSGITHPMKRVIEKRFLQREHQPKAPPRMEVHDVEQDLTEIINKLSKDPKGNRNKLPTLAAAQAQNRVLEEIEEVIVEYEPWMDANGSQPSGIEFDSSDPEANQHPEIWLDPSKIQELRRQEQERLHEEERKKQALLAKKQRKKEKKEKRQKEQQAAFAASSSTGTGGGSGTLGSSQQKKGIASRKNEPPVDDVTQAALDLAAGSADDLMAQALDDEDDFDFGFDLDGDDLGFEM
jgi:transcription initiation factor TFIID subunit 7